MTACGKSPFPDPMPEEATGGWPGPRGGHALAGSEPGPTVIPTRLRVHSRPRLTRRGAPALPPPHLHGKALVNTASPGKEPQGGEGVLKKKTTHAFYFTFSFLCNCLLGKLHP